MSTLWEQTEQRSVDGATTATAAKVVATLPSVVPSTTAIDERLDPLASAAAADHMQHALDLIGVQPGVSGEGREVASEAAAHRLLGIAPRDPIEAMMTTQMLALHAATIDCARRAALPDQHGVLRRDELNLAQKTSRAFTQLVETMDRRRRGGEQKMTVEHVHVHAGGQAIVGNVTGATAGRASKVKD